MRWVCMHQNIEDEDKKRKAIAQKLVANDEDEGEELEEIINENELAIITKKFRKLMPRKRNGLEAWRRGSKQRVYAMNVKSPNISKLIILYSRKGPKSIKKIYDGNMEWQWWINLQKRSTKGRSCQPMFHGSWEWCII